MVARGKILCLVQSTVQFRVIYVYLVEAMSLTDVVIFVSNMQSAMSLYAEMFRSMTICAVRGRWQGHTHAKSYMRRYVVQNRQQTKLNIVNENQGA